MQLADNFSIEKTHFIGNRSGRHVFLFGATNSGKTNTMMRMARGWHAFGWPLVAIDPMGQFSALRQIMPVIVASAEGDAHITPDASTAPALARLVVAHRVSLVLDVSMYEEDDAMAMLSAFLESFRQQMFQVKKPEPFALFIDEAQEYVPQGRITPLSKTIIDLCKRGRHKNISVNLSTQRPASVDKNAMSQATLVIAHRLIAAQDIAVIDENMPTKRTETNRIIKGLLPGEAIVYGDTRFLRRADADLPDEYRRVQVHYEPLLDEDDDAPDTETTSTSGEIGAALLDALANLRPEPASGGDSDEALRAEIEHLKQDHADELAELERQYADLEAQHATAITDIYERHAAALAQRDRTIEQLRREIEVQQRINENQERILKVAQATVQEVTVSTRMGAAQALAVRDHPAPGPQTSAPPQSAIVAGLPTQADIVAGETTPVQQSLFRSERALKASQGRQEAAFARLVQKAQIVRPFAQAGLAWLLASGKRATAREIARATGFSESTVAKHFWNEVRYTGLVERSGEWGEEKVYRAIASHFFDEQFPDLDAQLLLVRLQEELAV